MIESKYDIFEVIEYRDGCKYRLKKVAEIWIPLGTKDLMRYAAEKFEMKPGVEYDIVSTLESRRV